MAGAAGLVASVVAGHLLADRLAPRRPQRVGKVVVHTRDDHSIEGLLVGEDAFEVELERARLVDDEAIDLAGRVRIPVGNVRFVQQV